MWLEEEPMHIWRKMKGYRSKDDNIAAYASISRSFQYAVERWTFQDIQIKSTEFERFKEAFHDKHKYRRGYLKGLYLTIILPEYKEKYYKRLEREPDRQVNNKAFTEAIATLFAFLSGWTSTDQGAVETPRFLLSIEALSNSDFGYRPEQYDAEGERRYSNDYIDDDTKQERWRRFYLAIDDLDTIKNVECVSWFRCQEYRWGPIRHANGSRSFEPASMAKLATRMLQLECINWGGVSDDEKWTRFVAERQQRRYDFARSLYHLPVQQLTCFMLRMWHTTPNNHIWQNSSFLYASDPKTDWLSLGLHHISQAPSLRTFVIENSFVLSPTILWPASILEERAFRDLIEGNTFESKKSPHWPSLQHFVIKACPIAADVSWLFDGIRNERPTSPLIVSEDVVELDGSDSDEPDLLSYRIEGVESGHLPTWLFRGRLKDSALEQWIEAMASAINRMPNL